MDWWGRAKGHNMFQIARFGVVHLAQLGRSLGKKPGCMPTSSPLHYGNFLDFFFYGSSQLSKSLLGHNGTEPSATTRNKDFAKLAWKVTTETGNCNPPKQSLRRGRTGFPEWPHSIIHPGQLLGNTTKKPGERWPNCTKKHFDTNYLWGIPDIGITSHWNY